MKQIPLTQGKFALVDDEDYDFLMQWKWRFCKSINGSGYAVRTTHSYSENGKRLSHSILMHRQILNAKECEEVDHQDRNKLNNQKVNIRICTHADNQKNIGIRSDNKSGHKGVFWSKKDKRWISIIQSNNKKYVLGYFKDLNEASKAYNEAAEKHHGQFANLNTAQ